jgi:hypothetical protein
MGFQLEACLQHDLQAFDSVLPHGTFLFTFDRFGEASIKTKANSSDQAVGLP